MMRHNALALITAERVLMICIALRSIDTDDEVSDSDARMFLKVMT